MRSRASSSTVHSSWAKRSPSPSRHSSSVICERLVKAAELVERAVLVAEEIAHQMLDAPREQASHARRGMEYLAQLLSDLLGVTIGAAVQLLKLVDE